MLGSGETVQREVESSRWSWCIDYIANSRTCITDFQSPESCWQTPWFLCRRRHRWQSI